MAEKLRAIVLTRLEEIMGVSLRGLNQSIPSAAKTAEKGVEEGKL